MKRQEVSNFICRFVQITHDANVHIFYIFPCSSFLVLGHGRQLMSTAFLLVNNLELFRSWEGRE